MKKTEIEIEQPIKCYNCRADDICDVTVGIVREVQAEAIKEE